MSKAREVLSSQELLQHRILSLLAALIIVGLGIIRSVVDTEITEVFWERLLLASAILSVGGLSFFYKGPAYRYAVYAVLYLVTLWAVGLLVLNDFSVNYALGIFIVVAASSALFRSVPALGCYLVASVLVVLLAGTLGSEPIASELSRSLFAVHVAVVSLLLFVIMAARLEKEEELHRREEYHRALIENAEDAIWVMDGEGRLTYASPASFQLLGYSPEELPGHSPADLVHAEDQAAFGRALEQLAGKPGGHARTEFRTLREDGRVRHVDCELQNLLHHDAVGGIVANSRDVTERVELEEELRRAQRMEAVGRLASGVAHDFNNILTVIFAHLDHLLAGLQDDSSLREPAEEIRDAAARAARVTRNLLAVGKRQVMEPIAFDLGEKVKELETMLQSLAGDGVTVQVVSDGEALPVRADPSQIERVVVNLVANARDAMRGGGEITLETTCSHASPPVDDGLADPPRSEFCVLSVSDEGIGIPKEELDRIFDPFFTTKEEGTGLGLAISYGLVKQSGGTIEVESEPGRGSTFRVILPRLRSPLRLSSEPPTEQPGH